MPTTVDIESQRMLLGTTPVRKLYHGANLIGTRIAELFANGEQGVWFDPSDLSTLFQDAAGTIPVTGVEQPVGLMLDKSGRGNHTSQVTTTARPILSARVNLLNNTPWEGAVVGAAETCLPPTGWVKGFWTSGSIDAITDVNGDKALTFTATSGRIQFSQTLSVKEGDVLVSRVDVLATSGLSAQALLDFTGSGTRQFFFNGSPISGSTLISQSGQLSCTFTAGVGTTSVSARFGIGTNASASGTVTVCRPDFRYAVDAPNLPAYQRVISSSEYSTEGFQYYLRFDGVDDFMSTASTVNLSMASELAAMVAVYVPPEQTARGTVLELGTSYANPGCVGMEAPMFSATSVGMGYRGSGVESARSVSAGKDPIGTVVFGGTLDLNAPLVQLRVNSINKQQSTISAGPGPFANATLFLGTRNGNLQRFKGRLYGAVLCGKRVLSPELNSLEQFLRNKSRAY